MLADQFHAAASAARNTVAADEIARLTWRAHAKGQLADTEAEAVSEALQARRRAFARPQLHQGQPWGFPGPPDVRGRLIAKPRSRGAVAKL